MRSQPQPSTSLSIPLSSIGKPVKVLRHQFLLGQDGGLQKAVYLGREAHRMMSCTFPTLMPPYLPRKRLNPANLEKF